jgi:hypothetical protein
LKVGQQWVPAYREENRKRVLYESKIGMENIKLKGLEVNDQKVTINENILDVLLTLREELFKI